MIVVPTTDRNNYLETLNKCDKITGVVPFDGANATKEQIQLFIDYLANLIENKLHLVISYAKGEIMSFSESEVIDNDPEKTTDNQYKTKTTKPDDPENDPENMVAKRHKVILNFIKMNPKISRKEIAEILKFSDATIKRDLQQLKSEGIIERVGGDRGGYWRITN